MKMSCFLYACILPVCITAQSYTTKTQGANNGNGGAYVAPVVTKTYTIKSVEYTPPPRSPVGSSVLNSKNFPVRDAGNKPGSGGNAYTPAANSSAPATAEDYRYLGIGKYAAKKFDEAISFFNKAIELDPKNAQAYLEIALCKYKLKDYAGSIPFFNKAIEIQPSYDYAYMSRGDAKQMLNDLNGAVADYNIAVVTSPYINTYYNRGIAKHNLEDYNGAVTDFSKVIELCEEMQKSWDMEFEKTNATSKVKKEAREKAGREIDREPMYAGSFYKRGSAKMHLRDNTAALEDFNTAVQIDPGFTDAIFSRGLSHFVAGNKDKGCADLKNAVALGYKAAIELVKKYCQ